MGARAHQRQRNYGGVGNTVSHCKLNQEKTRNLHKEFGTLKLM